MPRLLEDAPITTRAWTWWLLSSTAAACALVAMLNLLVDPTAQLGSGLVDPVAAGPRDRTAKAALLLGSEMPDIVVLGSSRSKKLDPARLGDWLRPVNAAVVGGDLFEARVLTAALADRARREDRALPQLVAGIDIEQFRDSSLHGSGFLDVPSLAHIARREASGSDGGIGDEVARVGRLLLTWQTTKASIAALRARSRGSGMQVGGAAAELDDGAFTATGIPQSDRSWFVAAAAARFARRTPARVDASIAEYRATYDTIGDRLDPAAVADLHALARIAHDAGGPPPLLYITPAHPGFARAMAEGGRDARRARVLTLLRRVERSGVARVLDCSSGCIDGNVRSWIDGTHPSPLGTQQMSRTIRLKLLSIRRPNKRRTDALLRQAAGKNLTSVKLLVFKPMIELCSRTPT